MRSVSATGPSEEEALTALHARARDVWGGALRSITPKTTISELADAWLDEVRRRGKVAESTVHTYSSWVRTIVKPHMGAYTIEQFDAGLADQELLNLSESAPSKAKHARTVLNMMLKVAVRNRAIAYNPIDAVETIRVDPPKPSALSDVQLQVLLRELATWRGANPERRGGARPDTQLLQDLLLLMLATSERIGEAVLLGRDDITVEDGTMYIHIWDTVQSIPGKGAPRKGSPKRADQQRRVPLPPFAEEIVRRRLAEYRPNPQGLLFPSRNGTPRSTANYRRLLRAFRNARSEALEAAGIDVENLTPKTMRRSAATAVESHVSLSDAQSLLGHRHPGTTSTSYVERSRVVSSQTAKAIESAFPSASALTESTDEATDVDSLRESE